MKSGFIVVNKDRGIGSTKVVSILKRVLKPKKIGHAGTLDPLAEGVLVIAVNEATKLIRFVQDGKKEYEFEVSFGTSTSTDDMEGEVIEKSEIIPKIEEIEAILPEFIGKITQTPPKYSAIKIDGKRAYDLARENIDFEMKSRVVDITDLKIISHNNEKVRFLVNCGKGTYVRSLGRDIAIRLGTVAHISFLKRGSIGKFNLDNAIKLSDVDLLKTELENNLYPLNSAIDEVEIISVNGIDKTALCQGKKIITDKSDEKEVIVIDENHKIVCIAEVKDGFISPNRIVFDD